MLCALGTAWLQVVALFRWLRLYHFLASLGFPGVSDDKSQWEPVLYRKCPSRLILLTEMRWYRERSEAQAKEIEGISAEDHLGEMMLSWRDRHVGRKRKSSAWLVSPTPQIASRHHWFGCRCDRAERSLPWPGGFHPTPANCLQSPLPSGNITGLGFFSGTSLSHLSLFWDSWAGDQTRSQPRASGTAAGCSRIHRMPWN